MEVLPGEEDAFAFKPIAVKNLNFSSIDTCHIEQ
jgi:hypothetical protein